MLLKINEICKSGISPIVLIDYAKIMRNVLASRTSRCLSRVPDAR